MTAGAVLGLGLATLAAALLSLSSGASDIPLATLAGSLLRGSDEETSFMRFVLLDVRAPRTVVAWLVGAALGASGCALQNLFRNPLADPSVLGVSASAALSAQLVLFFGVGLGLGWLLPLAATLGAGVSTVVLVFAMGTPQGRSLETIVLAGVALGQVAVAGSSLLISAAFADFTVAQRLMHWLLGSLDGRSWLHVAWGLAPLAAGALVLARRSRELDALSFGDVTATSLGVDVRGVRREVVLAAALLTGASVAIGGVIGFVGLLVPHLVRRFSGAGYSGLLAGSVLGGGLFVLVADVVARRVVAPAELQIGVVTAAVGAPWFVLLLHRRLQEAAP